MAVGGATFLLVRTADHALVLRKEALGVAEYWSTWLFIGLFCLNGYQCVVMSLPKKGADQQF